MSGLSFFSGVTVIYLLLMISTALSSTDISASDINVEVVNAEATPDSVDFTLSDFSIITVLTNGKMVPGATQSFKDVLGDGVGYGIVANEDFILICKFGCNGSDPEIVMYKRR